MGTSDLISTEFGVLVTSLVTAYAVFIVCVAALVATHIINHIKGT